jgi:hypothetical protein
MGRLEPDRATIPKISGDKKLTLREIFEPHRKMMIAIYGTNQRRAAHSGASFLF